MQFLIDKIEASEIKDSRGNLTISVVVGVNGSTDSFAVPSGASTGAHEALEIRDSRGSVKQAVDNVNKIIAPALLGHNAMSQKEIDQLMINLDHTENKSNLGANAILGVSVALAKATAKAMNVHTYAYLQQLSDSRDAGRVPYLFMNLINGGKHAKNNLAFQEYHIVPQTDDVEEAIKIGKNVQSALVNIIEREYGEKSYSIGDEGGLAPNLMDIKQPLVFLREALEGLGLQNKVRLALDVAATSFYQNGKYLVNQKLLDKKDLMLLYEELINEFNILSIEDPFYEEDFESFRILREKFPNLIIVGDDLTVTNKVLLDKAIANQSISAMIIKLNQIGTLSETIDTMALAVKNNIKLIVSHRSGETMDDFIADLACAFCAWGLKAGSPLAKERIVKYKRLLEITKSKLSG